jgi:hypothetical protein
MSRQISVFASWLASQPQRDRPEVAGDSLGERNDRGNSRRPAAVIEERLLMRVIIDTTGQFRDTAEPELREDF